MTHTMIITTIMLLIVILSATAFSYHQMLSARRMQSSMLSRIHNRQLPSLLMAKKKWDRESLSSSEDAFAEEDDVVIINESYATLSEEDKKAVDRKDKKKKMRLDPETLFFEGPPSLTEIVFPAISILTVIGIIPFVAALARQVWVRYKFTSRRISIQSGFGGNTQTEIIYSEVEEIRFAFRGFGASGDMVLFLKDGAKVELRHVPKFQEVYEFVLGKCDDECKQKSMKIPKQKQQQQ